MERHGVDSQGCLTAGLRVFIQNRTMCLRGCCLTLSWEKSWDGVRRVCSHPGVGRNSLWPGQPRALRFSVRQGVDAERSVCSLDVTPDGSVRSFWVWVFQVLGRVYFTASLRRLHLTAHEPPSARGPEKSKAQEAKSFTHGHGRLSRLR